MCIKFQEMKTKTEKREENTASQNAKFKINLYNFFSVLHGDTMCAHIR